MISELPKCTKCLSSLWPHESTPKLPPLKSRPDDYCALPGGGPGATPPTSLSPAELRLGSLPPLRPHGKPRSPPGPAKLQ